MSEKAKGKMNVGVDLGTSNLLIYVEGRGTVFNEPSIIAIDKASNKVVSVGFDAAELVGKTHDKVEVIKPLNGGVISDIDMIREILMFTFNNLFMSSLENINKLLICIPSEITDTEKAAIMQLGKELGIEKTYIDEEIKAAALDSAPVRNFGDVPIDTSWTTWRPCTPDLRSGGSNRLILVSETFSGAGVILISPIRIFVISASNCLPYMTRVPPETIG